MQLLTPKEQVHFELLKHLINNPSLVNHNIHTLKDNARMLAKSIFQEDSNIGSNMEKIPSIAGRSPIGE